MCSYNLSHAYKGYLSEGPYTFADKSLTDNKGDTFVQYFLVRNGKVLTGNSIPDEYGDELVAGLLPMNSLGLIDTEDMESHLDPIGAILLGSHVNFLNRIIDKDPELTSVQDFSLLVTDHPLAPDGRAILIGKSAHDHAQDSDDFQALITVPGTGSDDDDDYGDEDDSNVTRTSSWSLSNCW